MRLYLINPIQYIKTRSKLFGYFKFNKCDCGCTDYDGWGFNFVLFGISKN